MFKDLKTKLVSVLSTITGDNKPLKAVYGYMEPSRQSYPCALVRVAGGSQEIRLDSDSNELVMEFVIRVIIREKNTEAVEDQRLDLIDSVLGAFRTTANVDTLNGLVEKFDIASITPLDINEDQPVFGFDILVQASKIQFIS